MGALVDRTHKELSDEDIARIAGTYHAWRGEQGAGDYEDVPGFCKSTTTEQIAEHGFVLTPGRYVGAADSEEDDEPFDEKMKRLTAELAEQFAEAAAAGGGDQVRTWGRWAMEPEPWLPFGDLLAVPLRNGLTRPKSVRGAGTKMVNMGELFAHPRIENEPMDRVPLDGTEREKSLLAADDLLFARQSLTLEGAGKCSIFVGDTEAVTFESHIIRARLDRRVADPDFYYYYFTSPPGRASIQGIVEQVAAAGIRGSDLAQLRVPVPPLPKQAEIARVLRSLDDKLELNRHTNRTLESILRAVFRSWFVDFDVSRGAIGSETLESSSGVPDRLLMPPASTAYGTIPCGWSFGTIGDVAVERREPVKPSVIDFDTPYIGLEHMPRRSIDLSKWGCAGDVSSGKSAFRTGDILFGKLRPYFHKVGPAPVDGVCSTDIVVVRPNTPEWFGVVLGHLMSDAFVNHAAGSSGGTRMPRTKWRDMAAYGIPLPPVPVARTFNERFAPLVVAIQRNGRESRCLTAVRNALLPRLLSGLGVGTG